MTVMAGSMMQSMKPMNVHEIVEKAQAFEFNPHIALKYWFRTADTLLREAQIYEQEDNDQQAYLLYMRYVSLVADKLPQHPNARDQPNRKPLTIAIKAIPAIVERLEILKPVIEARYTTWQTAVARRRESRSSKDLDGLDLNVRRSWDFAETDPAITGNTTSLAAAENGELAVKLAHKEIRRRDAARRTIRQAGITEEQEHQRRTAGVWNDWENQLPAGDQTGEDEDLQRRMEDTRRRMDKQHDIIPDKAKKLQKPNRDSARPIPPPPPKLKSDYQYPSIQKSQPLQYDARSRENRRSNETGKVPPRPSKEAIYNTDPWKDQAPSRPEKIPQYEESSGSTSPVEEAQAFAFRPSAYLENGSPLRTVFLPLNLRETFLKIAAPNTRANLETCGILCGTLISNALFVSRLVIPEQESTSDTCETVNESALFDYCDSEDLMVLGWIHTHPTQTCFMSSRDLHTHCGYQVMMPESIAIVCAPTKNPSWGIFRLTDPPGMKSVLNCRQTGLFHPHAEENIYTDALRPGHVFEAKGLEFEVQDLRPGI